jgi:hypothetical protein
MFSRILAALVLVVVLGVSAQAVTVTTAVGNGADTYLTNDSKNDGNSVYGTGKGIEIRDYANTRQRIAYLRFDLTGITGDLSGATLSLDCGSDAKTMRQKWVGIYGLVTEASDSWDETTTCYNNAKGMVAAPLGYYAIGQDLYPRLTEMFLQELGVSGTRTICTSVTSDKMNAFLASDTNKLVTFAVIYEVSDSAADWWVASEEDVAANPALIAPTLTLPNAIPEPVTIAILGLGGLALLRRRR